MDTTYNINGGFKPRVRRFADLDGPDFYPTPAWATHALFDNEPFSGEICEPACGDGSMSEAFPATSHPDLNLGLVHGGAKTNPVQSSHRWANAFQRVGRERNGS